MLRARHLRALVVVLVEFNTRRKAILAGL